MYGELIFYPFEFAFKSVRRTMAVASLLESTMAEIARGLQKNQRLEMTVNETSKTP